MPRMLMEKQHARSDEQHKQKDESSKNETKINARDKKHCNRYEERL